MRVRPPWSQRYAGLGASSNTIAPCQTFTIVAFPIGNASPQVAFSNKALWKISAIVGDSASGYTIMGTYMGPLAMTIGATYDPDGQNIMSIQSVSTGAQDASCTPVPIAPIISKPAPSKTPTGIVPIIYTPLHPKSPVSATGPVSSTAPTAAASSSMTTTEKVVLGTAAVGGVLGIGLLVRAYYLK